jgi:hypothetical protein
MKCECPIPSLLLFVVIHTSFIVAIDTGEAVAV